jgi:hypothetical protein
MGNLCCCVSSSFVMVVIQFAKVERALLVSPHDTPDSSPLPVAVKSLKPYVITSAQELREVVLGARLLQALDHPHIASFYGVGCYRSNGTDAVKLMPVTVCLHLSVCCTLTQLWL